MEKSTISMAMFHSYAKLPEGTSYTFNGQSIKKKMICILKENLSRVCLLEIPSSESLLEWFRSISLNICIRFALGQCTVRGFCMFYFFLFFIWFYTFTHVYTIHTCLNMFIPNPLVWVNGCWSISSSLTIFARQKQGPNGTQRTRQYWPKVFHWNFQHGPTGSNTDYIRLAWYRTPDYAERSHKKKTTHHWPCKLWKIWPGLCVCGSALLQGMKKKESFVIFLVGSLNPSKFCLSSSGTGMWILYSRFVHGHCGHVTGSGRGGVWSLKKTIQETTLW